MRHLSGLLITIILIAACTGKTSKKVTLPVWKIFELETLPDVYRTHSELLSADSIDALFITSEGWNVDTSYSANGSESFIVKTHNNTISFGFLQNNQLEEYYLIHDHQLVYTYFDNGEEPDDKTYYFNGIAFAFQIGDFEPELINQFDSERITKADYWNFKKKAIRKLDYISRIIEF